MSLGDDVDPSWWAPALEIDNHFDAEWRPPEMLSPHLEALARGCDAGTTQEAVLTVLAKVSSAMLDPENWSEPFRPMMTIGDQRSALPSDLTEAEFGLLRRVLPHIEQALLRARVADVLWTFHDRADLSMLRTAIDAYRSVPLDSAQWYRRGQEAWRRAIEMVRRRGRGERERANEMAAALEQRILSGSTADRFMLIDLSDLLRTAGLEDDAAPARIGAHLLGVAADAAADPSNLRLARHLERAAQSWLVRARDTDGINESIARVAVLYEAEATQRLDGPSGSAMAAGLFLEKAIQTLRTLPLKYRREHQLDTRLDALREQLQENRTFTLEEMVPFQSDPIDLSDAADEARRAVSGLQPFEALVNLAVVYPLPSAEKERELAREMATGSIRHLFGGATYAPDGRKVATTSGGPDNTDEAISADLIRNATMTRGIVCTGFIIPALEVVAFEHRFDLAQLRRMCREAPVVPEGHEDLWARGIQHGLNSDFPSAVSVLVPQIEHAVRRLLKRRDVYTLLVDDATGVETEKGLGALLTMPETESVLGSDLRLALQTLLVEQQGDNLRNNIAHGLLHDGQAWSAAAVYAWWLCLRLVVVPLWRMYNPGEGQDDSEGKSTGEKAVPEAAAADASDKGRE